MKNVLLFLMISFSINAVAQTQQAVPLLDDSVIPKIVQGVDAAGFGLVSYRGVVQQIRAIDPAGMIRPEITPTAPTGLMVENPVVPRNVFFNPDIQRWVKDGGDFSAGNSIDNGSVYVFIGSWTIAPDGKTKLPYFNFVKITLQWYNHCMGKQKSSLLNAWQYDNQGSCISNGGFPRPVQLILNGGWQIIP